MKRRTQAAIDERRLAATRSADDREEARGGQLVDNRVNLALATEEEIFFLLAEWPQARKRIRVDLAHCEAPIPGMAAMIGARSLSRNELLPSITPRSSMSTRSCLSLVAGAARYVKVTGIDPPGRTPRSFLSSLSVVRFQASSPAP